MGFGLVGLLLRSMLTGSWSVPPRSARFQMSKCQNTASRVHGEYAALVRSLLEEEGRGLTGSPGLIKATQRKIPVATLSHSNLLEVAPSDT